MNRTVVDVYSSVMLPVNSSVMLTQCSRELQLRLLRTGAGSWGHKAGSLFLCSICLNICVHLFVPTHSMFFQFNSHKFLARIYSFECLYLPIQVTRFLLNDIARSVNGLSSGSKKASAVHDLQRSSTLFRSYDR